MLVLMQVISEMIKMGMTQDQVRNQFRLMQDGTMDAEMLMRSVGCAPWNEGVLRRFKKALPKLESAIVISFIKV